MIVRVLEELCGEILELLQAKPGKLLALALTELPRGSSSGYAGMHSTVERARHGSLPWAGTISAGQRLIA